MSIVLGVPEVRGSTVSVTVEAGEASRYLRSGTFSAEFSGVDISGVDPAVLIVPALGSVLPIAYAAGVPVRVDAVDREFAAAATQLSAVFSAIHPKFASADRFAIHGQVKDAAATTDASGAALLYSGGLDSVASLLANVDRVRVLVSVWGADVPLTDGALWQKLSEQMDKAAALTAGCRKVQVRTNARHLTKDFRLIHDFFGHGGDWWGGAHHGMVLSTLTAPVAAALGLDTTYLAASHTDDFNVPWGSSPSIDNSVRWGSTRVSHDLFHMSRQQKISQLVGPYLRTGRELALAVCYQPNRGAIGVNCGRCEKCLRTATGLMVERLSPADVGLEVPAGGYRDWRAALSRGERTMQPNQIHHWRDVQSGIPDDLTPFAADDREYLTWLREFDFGVLAAPPVGVPKRIRSGLKYQARRAVDRLSPKVQQRVKELVAVGR